MDDLCCCQSYCPLHDGDAPPQCPPWFTGSAPSLAANILTVSELFDSVAQDFFQQNDQNPIARPLSSLTYLLDDLTYILGWRDGLVVSALDQRPRGRGFESAGCRLSCSNHGPVVFLQPGPGLTQPSILSGSVNEYRL